MLGAHPDDHGPRPELFGLSPAQAKALLSIDWGPSAPLTLNEDIALDELRGAALFTDLRALLGGIAERGSVPATATGDLDSGFVNWLLDRITWFAEDAQWMRQEEPDRISEAQLVPVQVLLRR